MFKMPKVYVQNFVQSLALDKVLDIVGIRDRVQLIKTKNYV